MTRMSVTITGSELRQLFRDEGIRKVADVPDVVYREYEFIAEIDESDLDECIRNEQDKIPVSALWDLLLGCKDDDLREYAYDFVKEFWDRCTEEEKDDFREAEMSDRHELTDAIKRLFPHPSIDRHELNLVLEDAGYAS